MNIKKCPKFDIVGGISGFLTEQDMTVKKHRSCFFGTTFHAVRDYFPEAKLCGLLST